MILHEKQLSDSRKGQAMSHHCQSYMRVFEEQVWEFIWWNCNRFANMACKFLLLSVTQEHSDSRKFASWPEQLWAAQKHLFSIQDLKWKQQFFWKKRIPCSWNMAHLHVLGDGALSLHLPAALQHELQSFTTAKQRAAPLKNSVIQPLYYEQLINLINYS